MSDRTFYISSHDERVDGDMITKTKFVVFQRKGSPGVVGKDL